MTANLTVPARLLITLLVTFGSTLNLFAGDNDNNRVDNLGNRQGYWVIKAYMINEKDFTPDATVEEGTYIDNRREGLWTHYWPNGKTKSEINYAIGKPMGTYKVYYENGQLEEAANWQGGKQVGDFVRYHVNGNMQQQFLFAENGRRNGMQKYYYENGTLAMEVTIENGLENGTCKRYNEEGQLIEEKTFTAGAVKAGSIKEYGEPEMDLARSDAYNSEVGKESTTSRDKVNQAEEFQPNGFNVLYDENGFMTQSGDFHNGRLWNGKWFKYNASGIVMRVEIYREGKFIGTGVMEAEEK